jgi:hypothetical protein
VDWIVPTAPSCPEQTAGLIAPACIWPGDDKGPWIHTTFANDDDDDDDDDDDIEPQYKQDSGSSLLTA